MNIIRNRTMHPDLREDEVLVMENAIRIAIDSIINVLYSVNSARTHEYQRMVADRDKEIQRLECRSKDVEHELQLLRQDGCSCGLFGDEVGHHVGGEHSDTQEEMMGDINFDTEMTRGQESEMNISCLFARTPSQISSQSHELAFSSSINSLSIEQICVSNSVEAPVVPEGPSDLSISTSSLIVKEEPCDIDTQAVLIKWEMSEHNTDDHQETVGDLHQNDKIPSIKRRLENRERLKKFREKLYANPEKHRVFKERERLRNCKRSVPMSELPEETQRQKRAAWRAASRRYYARKVGRQHTPTTHASPSGFIPQCTSGFIPQCTSGFIPQCTPCSLPVPFMDKRRRTLISELPKDTQTMQREAWRAASRRYYARKMARLQADPTQLNHLLQNTDTTEGTSGQNNNGLGGIVCS